MISGNNLVLEWECPFCGYIMPNKSITAIEKRDLEERNNQLCPFCYHRVSCACFEVREKRLDGCF